MAKLRGIEATLREFLGRLVRLLPTARIPMAGALLGLLLVLATSGWSENGPGNLLPNEKYVSWYVFGLVLFSLSSVMLPRWPRLTKLQRDRRFYERLAELGFITGEQLAGWKARLIEDYGPVGRSALREFVDRLEAEEIKGISEQVLVKLREAAERYES